MSIEEGRPQQLEISANSIEETWLDILSEYKSAAESKDILIHYKKSKKKLPSLNFDEVKIRGVFSRLIDNAIRFTPEGGKVSASFTLNKRVLRFEIEDSGIGISKDEASDIGEPFFRASNAFSVEPDGSGVSLALVRHYLKLHGGDFGFRSKLNKGSIFWFDLLIKQL